MKLSFPLPTLRLVSCLLLGMAAVNVSTLAAPGEVDPDFDPGSGINGPVNALVVQPDGRVILAGSFTTVRGLPRKNLARLHPDGSGDPSFTSSAPRYPIHCLALQSDGKLLVGSEFENFGITRRNPDGSPDTEFDANALSAMASTEPSQPLPVKAIVVQPDGKVILSGEQVVRLNGDGTLDSSFAPAAYGWSTAIALQPDGKVIVGGNFYDLSLGSYRFGLIRLLANGARDDSFDGAAGTDAAIQAIRLQPDGKILFAGGFTTVGGMDTLVVRLNQDGGIDPTFAVVPGGAATRPLVHALGLQSDGKILVGGQFQSVGGVIRPNLARLNADGTVDTAYPDEGSGVTSQWSPHPTGAVLALEVNPDGTVLLGGSFGVVHQAKRHSLARLLPPGRVDASFDPGRGVSAFHSTVVVQPDGKLLMGDALTFTQGIQAYARLRLNPDGSPDDTFIPAANFSPNLLELPNSDCPDGPFFCQRTPIVTSVAVQPDGKVLVGGYLDVLVTGDEVFVYLRSGALGRFHADGTRDTSFVSPSFHTASFDFYDEVSALALLADGRILVAGRFPSIQGTPRHGLARLLADGTLDPGFVPATGPDAVIQALALQPDGKILLGGSFGRVAGTVRQGIVRLNPDGSLDDTFNSEVGMRGGIQSVALQADGKLLIGGHFDLSPGTTLNGVVRLHANGSLDTSFPPVSVAGLNDVESVRPTWLPDGRVLLSGSFLSVQGVLRPTVARLLGDVSIPALTFVPSGANAVLAWPVTAQKFQLQEATDLSLPNPWLPVELPTIESAGRRSVTVSTASGQRYFRLQSP